MKLLVDTGASISVIFTSCMSDSDYNNDKRKRIEIKGISGSTSSLGSADIFFLIGNSKIQHEFFVLNDFSQNFNGILGSDFFTKYSSIIDYENFNFSFWYNGKKHLLPLESNCNNFTSIPARCEAICYFKVNSDSDYIVLPEEIAEGVFSAAIVTKSIKNLLPVKILNINDREINIKNFSPKIDKLSNYNVCAFVETEFSVDRIDKLLKTLNKTGLNKEEKLSIDKICAKFHDVFHLENDPLTVINNVSQKIHLKDDAMPVYVKPYRLPVSQKDEIHKQVHKMLKSGIIEETSSEWSAPLLIVPKKPDLNGNKKWRIVIDYRLLNRQIRDDKFPLPCIDEILDSLSGAIYFSHLDLSQGYYQVELDPKSRPYTAFTTDNGQYQLTRLPMGLKISPNAFSRAMTLAMSGLNYESCFVYLDDLIVFGSSLNQHNKNLVKVMNRLRKVNLKLNPNKCEFLKKQILYLGHIISSEGILPDPEKVNIMLNYPTPKDANETKRFVAFANYYRKFIKNFADIATPLNQLSKKGVKFIWSEQCQKSFETLKRVLVKPPILQYPDFSDKNQFILRTDASGFALGAVLSNKNDKPVAYASRTLNRAERNYCTIEKELLGICWAVKKFRPYLFGRKFQILTDHKPLLYLFGMKNPSSRLTKFRLTLEEYDFVISYVTGKTNVTADALSRISIKSSELKELNDNVSSKVFAVTRAQQLKIHNRSAADFNKVHIDNRLDHPGVVELLKPSVDKDIVELKVISTKDVKKLDKNMYVLNNVIYDKTKNIIYIKQATRSTSILDMSLRDLIIICKEYNIPELIIIKSNNCAMLLNDLSKFKNEIKKSKLKITVISKNQHIIDREVQQLVLNDFHLLPTGGHAGVKRTYNNIKKYYFWTGMRKSVEDFIGRCDDCQRFKHSKVHKEPLTVTTTASTAMQKVFLDLVGPIDNDLENNRYIFTLQCELTKFVEAYPIPNKEADTVARVFVNNFILRYGIPHEVVTDQGTEFLASIFQETCKLLRIKTLKSTAYHHQTLGALENSHKSLGTFLRIYTSKFPNAWSSWVPYWCFSYNNTVHSETKYTPHELVYGKPCHLPSNLTSTIDPLYNFDDYPKELKFRLQTAWNDAKNNLLESKIKRKTKYDERCKIENYVIGDKILLKNESGSKMDSIFKGPYKVVDVKNPNIVIKVDRKFVEVHKDRVKLYQG